MGRGDGCIPSPKCHMCSSIFFPIPCPLPAFQMKSRPTRNVVSPINQPQRMNYRIAVGLFLAQMLVFPAPKRRRLRTMAEDEAFLQASLRLGSFGERAGLAAAAFPQTSAGASAFMPSSSAAGQSPGGPSPFARGADAASPGGSVLLSPIRGVGDSVGPSIGLRIGGSVLARRRSSGGSAAHAAGLDPDGTTLRRDGGEGGPPGASVRPGGSMYGSLYGYNGYSGNGNSLAGAPSARPGSSHGVLDRQGAWGALLGRPAFPWPSPQAHRDDVSSLQGLRASFAERRRDDASSLQGITTTGNGPGL